ncbi:hypothetical protein [Streptomyces tibetensis]|uniref:hypothetical protein n=1 Tax=Streptomyces tibetensis TaxID=2382123 RepID=UPI00340598DD
MTSAHTGSRPDPAHRLVLRFAHRQGAGKGVVDAPIRLDPAAPDTSGQLPPGADPRRGKPLPRGAHDLLAELAYPAGRIARSGSAQPHGDPLGLALQTAFGLLRRETCNPYNDHRAHPSVRSKFPVHTFVTEPDGRSFWHDPYRVALLPLTDGSGPPGEAPPGGATRIHLVGRYTHLPAYYRPLRGSLTEAELGINLRSLALALDLFGLRESAALRLPGPGDTAVLDALGLRPTHEWTLPLTVSLGGLPAPGAERALAGEGVPDDAEPAEITAVNRTQNGDGRYEPLPPSLPDLPDAPPTDWADVLWRRTSGRMPRGLSGMNGRRRPAPATALTDGAAWATVEPPGAALAAVASRLRLTAVVQDIEGHPAGTYRVRRDGITRVPEGAATPADLEPHYGYPLTTGNGCDVRHATALWFVTADVASLVAEHGPGAWTLAQYAAGWAAQGLGLSAAAHRHYARPTRAFKDAPTVPLLGLAPSETILLAVVTGTGRYLEPLLDLRL